MINDHLTLSDAGRQLLCGIETLRLKPYDDQTGNEIQEWCQGATIGYGHLIRIDEWERYRHGIDTDSAVALFQEDLAPFAGIVRRKIRVPLQQQQFDALVMLAYNIGRTNFADSSVVKMVNDPRAVTKFPTLEKAWKAWNKSQGRISNGLINRRRCELDVYQRGIYKRW